MCVISILFAVGLVLATEARVDMDMFEANTKAILDHIGSNRALCAVVKENAYGHGDVPMAFAALAAGATYLAVDAVSEGLKLREAGIKAPILLMAEAMDSELDDVVESELTPFIGDEGYAKILSDAATKADRSICVHLVINTGMNCFGCNPQDAPDLAARIASLPFLIYEGTATHLFAAESNINATNKQLEIFRDELEKIRAKAIDPGIVHAANSAGLTFHKESWFDMVRVASILYGFVPKTPPGWPPPEWPSGGAIKPVLEFVTKIVSLDREAVSYDRRSAAEGYHRIATISIGYGSWFPLTWPKYRANISMYVRGHQCNITGLMGSAESTIALKFAGIVKLRDEVDVIGGSALNAAQIADSVGVTPSIVTGWISPGVNRVYITNDENKARLLIPRHRNCHSARGPNSSRSFCVRISAFLRYYFPLLRCAAKSNSKEHWN
jgi:alanine racemase